MDGDRVDDDLTRLGGSCQRCQGRGQMRRVLARPSEREGVEVSGEGWEAEDDDEMKIEEL